MKKSLYGLLLVLPLAFSTLSACTTNTPTSDLTSGSEVETVETSLEITKDGYQVDELDVYVGSEFTLGVDSTGLDGYTITWSSSNTNVASIDQSGYVSVIGKGTTVIYATVTELPYITDSIFVNATNKVEQTGVGSGVSPSDPIYLGNEGEDEPIQVIFIEMQHIYADSILIKKGNVEILIDAGWEYDGYYVNQILTQYCTDGILDMLIVTHSDSDHIDGLTVALDTISSISLMIDYGGAGSSTVAVAREFTTSTGGTYHSAYDCVNGGDGAYDRYYLTSEFYVDILDTGNYITADGTNASNGNSVATLFTYNDFTFFTAGDLTTSSESALLSRESLPEVTLYKASHHGSSGSNSQALLDTLNPKGVAISAARANQYNDTPGAPSEDNTYNLNAASGHPHAAAIERIYNAPNISQNLNVYWNAANGTMKFTSYGTDSFTFQGSETMKGYYDLTLTDGVAVWNEELQDFENKVTGEENYKLHETKVFQFRDYIQYLPEWAQEEYFPDYTA